MIDKQTINYVRKNYELSNSNLIQHGISITFQAVLVYFFFCLAFAGSFFVIMSSQPSTVSIKCK